MLSRPNLIRRARMAKRTELPSMLSIAVSLTRMMNEKCVRSPQFSPHPRHELFLSCVHSIISEWHSCLFEFLSTHNATKLWRLNDLQKPTSCLREIHKSFSKNAGVSKWWETKNIDWSGRRDLNSGPPAPKAGALPGCATPRHEVRKDYKGLPNRTVAPSD
jgi:hypothetical protein